MMKAGSIVRKLRQAAAQWAGARTAKCLSAQLEYSVGHAHLTTPVLLLLSVASLAAATEDWPQWRGPALDGTVSGSRALPTRWSASEDVAWRIALPSPSAATPAIAGGLVFVHSATMSGNLDLWAVRQDTGALAWHRTIDRGANRRIQKHDLTSPSPVADGRMVWSMSGAGTIVAFDHAGTGRWRRNLQQDYGVFGQQFGFASSPLLVEDALFVSVIHGMYTDAPSYVVRLDAMTGKVVWRVERPSPAVRESRDAYSTPTVIRRSGRHAVLVAGADVVTAHHPATGRELWRVGGLNPDNRPYHQVVASPFVSGDLLIVPTRVKPLVAFRLDASIDRAPHTVWTFDRGADVPTPVSDGSYLYVLSDRGVLNVVDLASGELTYGPRRLAVGTYTSSLIVGGGHLYATSEEGTTTVIRTGPRFEVLAENRLDDECLSSLAVSRGRIFVRTASFLWAIGGDTDGDPER